MFPSIGGSVDKMWYVHTVEYYSALKLNIPWINTTKYTNFKNIMLRTRKEAMLYDSIFFKFENRQNVIYHEI